MLMLKSTSGMERLARDLTDLGIESGITLIVHSSLSAIGWVEGGASTVVRALIEVLGKDGTLAMPAATPQCAEPDPLTVFVTETTPTKMGTIAETFRTWPGTLRSTHPLESVCARGPLAAEVTSVHPLAFSEGPGTPFGRLHDCDSAILLLGVGFNRCTALHYAESLSKKRRTARARFPTIENGETVWIEVPNVADDNDRHFPIIGERYVAAGRAVRGNVGEATCSLFSMRDLVGFAVDYFDTTRTYSC